MSGLMKLTTAGSSQQTHESIFTLYRWQPNQSPIITTKISEKNETPEYYDWWRHAHRRLSILVTSPKFIVSLRAVLETWEES